MFEALPSLDKLYSAPNAVSMKRLFDFLGLTLPTLPV